MLKFVSLLIFRISRADSCTLFDLNCAENDAVLSLNETCFNLKEPSFDKNFTNLYVSKTPELTEIAFSTACQLQHTTTISYQSCFNDTVAYIVHVMDINGDIVHLTSAQELTCTLGSDTKKIFSDRNREMYMF